MITARLSDYRQAPRKVRLVVDLVRGKTVAEARNSLNFLVKRASKPLLDLLNSAVANAEHNFNITSDKLFVKSFRVDEGMVLKRRRPRARGMAYPINKRTSHVFLELDTTDNMPLSKKAKHAAVRSAQAAKSPKK